MKAGGDEYAASVEVAAISDLLADHAPRAKGEGDRSALPDRTHIP